MNHCKIHQLDFVSFPAQLKKQYVGVKKVFLSHNHLESLDGIQFLQNVTHLSVQSNKLMDLEEFSKIQNPQNIVSLSVKGNPYISRHPNHASLLCDYFPNLKELDSSNILKEKPQIRFAKNLSRLIIPFIYRIDKITEMVQNVNFEDGD